MKSLLTIIGTTAAAAALTTSAAALATPGSNFGPPSLVVNGHFGTIHLDTQNLARDKDLKWSMVLKTLDASDVGSDRLPIAPGGYSGWHAHPAAVFVTVTQGSIIWINGSDPICSAHTYNTGESFIEDAYVIHNVRNASNSVPAEFIAIRINPTGAPFRLDRPQPNNCNF